MCHGQNMVHDVHGLWSSMEYESLLAWTSLGVPHGHGPVSHSRAPLGCCSCWPFLTLKYKETPWNTFKVAMDSLLKSSYGTSLAILLTYHPLRLRPGGFLGFATSERTQWWMWERWIQAPRASRLRPFWRLRRPTGTFLPESRKILKKYTYVPMALGCRKQQPCVWPSSCDSLRNDCCHPLKRSKKHQFEWTIHHLGAMGHGPPPENISNEQCVGMPQGSEDSKTRMRLWPINIQYLSKILVVQSK